MGVCTNRKSITVAKTGIMLQKSPGYAGAFLVWPDSACQYPHFFLKCYLQAAGK